MLAMEHYYYAKHKLEQLFEKRLTLFMVCHSLSLLALSLFYCLIFKSFCENIFAEARQRSQTSVLGTIKFYKSNSF